MLPINFTIYNPMFRFFASQPMNVGSLAEFTSTVVYSQQGHIVVQVRTNCCYLSTFLRLNRG